MTLAVDQPIINDPYRAPTASHREVGEDPAVARIHLNRATPRAHRPPRSLSDCVQHNPPPSESRHTNCPLPLPSVLLTNPAGEEPSPPLSTPLPDSVSTSDNIHYVTIIDIPTIGMVTYTWLLSDGYSRAWGAALEGHVVWLRVGRRRRRPEMTAADCSDKQEVRYEPDAYKVFQSLTNGLARQVLEETTNIVLQRGGNDDKAYRATEADVREALRRVARRLLEHEAAL